MRQCLNYPMLKFSGTIQYTALHNKIRDVTVPDTVVLNNIGASALAGELQGTVSNRLNGMENTACWCWITQILGRVIDTSIEPREMPASLLTHHRRRDMKCPTCKSDIEKIKVAGQSTYFCPSCQAKAGRSFTRYICQLSRASRSFPPRSFIGNGFWMKCTPSSSTPWWAMTLAV